ncbi:hypothetical protein SLA2020_288380 [Shorea laevis]
MKTLATSCSKTFVDKYGGGGGFHDVSLSRPEVCFLPTKMAANPRFLQLVSVQRKAIQPVRPSASLVPDSEVNMETAGTQSQEDLSKKVHVKFQLQKECSFGEHFLLVGDDPMIGLWDPESAIPMNWSEEHVWTVELDIPVGKSINFKFILKSSMGEIMWQPGQDRNLTTWQSESTITVCEDWENAQYQKIMEEKPLANQDEQPTLHSGIATVTENLTTLSKDIMSHKDRGLEVVNDNTYTAKESLQPAYKEVATVNSVPSLGKRITTTTVANNISYPEEDFMANGNIKVLSEKDEHNTVIVAEEIVGDNGLAVTFKNPTPADMEGNLINREGDAVLVPGLTSTPSTLSSEEEIQNEVEKNIMTDASVRVDGAKIHSLPEFDVKQELDVVAHQAVTNETSMEEEQINNKITHEPLEGREGQPDSEPLQSNVLENDINWGRKMLEKLLKHWRFH